MVAMCFHGNYCGNVFLHRVYVYSCDLGLLHSDGVHQSMCFVKCCAVCRRLIERCVGVTSRDMYNALLNN